MKSVKQPKKLWLVNLVEYHVHGMPKNIVPTEAQDPHQLVWQQFSQHEQGDSNQNGIKLDFYSFLLL